MTADIIDPHLAALDLIWRDLVRQSNQAYSPEDERGLSAAVTVALFDTIATRYLRDNRMTGNVIRVANSAHALVDAVLDELLESGATDPVRKLR